MSRHPRPILKRDSPPPSLSNDLPFVTCDYIFSPHVHFPPTPWMASMRFTHSAHIYDRAPIVVSPNDRLLPKRERKLHSPPAYFDFDQESRGRSRSRSCSRDSNDSEENINVKGSYFHPRAYEACTPEPVDVPSPPTLVPDLSPLDDSDDQVETPPDPNADALLVTPIPLRFASDTEGQSPSSNTRDTHALAANDDIAEPLSCSNLRLGPEHDGQRGRPTLRRRKGRVGSTVAFAADRDEGCLGGF